MVRKPIIPTCLTFALALILAGCGKDAPQPEIRPDRRVAVSPPRQFPRSGLRHARVVHEPSCFKRAKRLIPRGLGDTRIVEPRLKFAA